MALILKPLAQTKLIFRGAEKPWLLFRMLATL
jgi:hypothetical protein